MFRKFLTKKNFKIALLRSVTHNYTQKKYISQASKPYIEIWWTA